MIRTGRRFTGRHVVGFVAAVAMLGLGRDSAVAETVSELERPARVGVVHGGGPLGPPAGDCISPAERALVGRQIEAREKRLGPRAVSGAPHPQYEFFPMGGKLHGDLSFVNYVDLINDNSERILDWSCTDRTYDNHNGHDVSLRTFGEQAVGVPIFAAMDGVVVATRDGEPDMNVVWNPLVPANFVVVDHGAGRMGYYWHMRNGSVAVVQGDTVRAGQQLGLAASSGNSTGPHLHFETRDLGVVYEPFAGPCRQGPSGWTDQTPIRQDTYLSDFNLTDVFLEQYPPLPFDKPRTGTFVAGITPVSHWIVLHNMPAFSTWRVRFLRPDGSVAFDSGTGAFYNYGAYSWSWWWWRYWLDLSMTGTWHVHLDVNGQPLVEAPFDVVASSGDVVNRPAPPVTWTLEPAEPLPEQVPFCVVDADLLLDDPDYDIVRYAYTWRVNGEIVRQVVSAAHSDALARHSFGPGDELTCEVVAGDGHGPDGDRDSIADAFDNCAAASNSLQQDHDFDGRGDACDNCPTAINHAQSDVDADALGDACDNCPAAVNPDQLDLVHPGNGAGDACDDPDADRVSDLADNCPEAANTDQADTDLDGNGTACDSCPSIANPEQAESVACIEVVEDGGPCLETRIDLVRPDMAGELVVRGNVALPPSSITFEALNTGCGVSGRFDFFLNDVALGTLVENPTDPCACFAPVYRLAVEDAALLASAWDPDGPNLLRVVKTGDGGIFGWVRALLASNIASARVCIFDVGGGSCDSETWCNQGFTLSGFDQSADAGAAQFDTSVAYVTVPFQGGTLPDRLDVAALEDAAYELCVQTEGASDCREFSKNGERRIGINGARCVNEAPVAAAAAAGPIECDSPAGGLVRLDGSGSTDSDSTPEASDIVSFDWYRDAGLPSEVHLGQGPTLEVSVPVGTHAITLRVTDGAGESDTQTIAVTVVDTTPPHGGIGPAGGACFGPAALPVEIRAQFDDACDGSPLVTLDPPETSYTAHGDHAVSAVVSDSSGNALSTGAGFTIDLVAPTVRFLGRSGVGAPRIPAVLEFASADVDGASGGVIHEVVKLNGCTVADGATFGDRDGLLSDEKVHLGLSRVCEALAQCGLDVSGRAELSVEAADCAGNVAVDALALPALDCVVTAGRR